MFVSRYEQLKEDKSDVVDYLKRTLQQRLDQIVELQARLEGLKEVLQYYYWHQQGSIIQRLNKQIRCTKLTGPAMSPS